ncbi:MAG: hypothetical protein ABL984_07810, partial [Pyrinomonadaceae bacterium]
MRAISIVLVFLVMLTLAFGQTVSQRFETVRDSIGRHEYAKALDELKAFESQHVVSFQANNLDYLTARLSQKIGAT